MNGEGWSRLTGWKAFAAAYLALLVLSHGWQLANEGDGPDRGEEYSTVTVWKAVHGTVREGEPATVAYRDFYSGTDKAPPVVVVLHGSPVAGDELNEYARRLSANYRVIVPDMPAFDLSKQDLPDYSIRTYATYLDQFTDSLGIQKAHVAGYSFGGAVAIKFAHFYPEKVKSLILLSALGVQELELLGGYTLNHAIYGIQLGLVWLLHEAVPHFGLLENFPVDMAYARSFYDSDQRPIRSYLKNYRKPMLIQHGKKDGLVPLAAAREHHRLVPQSRLAVYEGGHIALVDNAAPMARDAIEFINAVERGRATTYAEASPERLSASRKPFEDIDFVRFEGISLVLIMVIIIFSTFVTEDLTCIGAGLMAARGLIGFWPATIACFLGILIGDMGLYLVGRWMGRTALRKAPFKWLVSEKDLDRTARWFETKGPAIIIASRFLPGSRLPTYFSAGIIGAGFWMFSFYFLLAAIIWTPLLVGISMLVGAELLNYFSLYRQYALPVFAGAVLFLVMLVKVVIPAFSYRGRRLLVSRWCRWSRWEFWPPYILYFPVFCYILWLWAKFGKLNLFTAANPGIEDGGFIGESKKLILDKFAHTGRVARYYLLPASAGLDWRMEKAVEFMESCGLDFPVVIKPDAGQRGEGVYICRDRQQLRTALEGRDYDQLIQEYVEGREFGVFYYRYPGTDTGAIYSITGKNLPELTGDGSSTVEELILNDKRAVCQARIHMKRHEEHLYEIPSVGEPIRLVELGTHARGAEFYDAGDLSTRSLQNTFDRVTSGVDGYYFGRFDVRVPDRESLAKGEEIKIIEVNGVTSESTNIYDASYGFWDAQRILTEQWYIAFSIGSVNFEKGAGLTPVTELARKFLGYRRKS